MCGIAGFMAKEPQAHLNERLLENMSTSMLHRGLNGRGYLYAQQGKVSLFLNGNKKVVKDVARTGIKVGLSHNRLSINDHSESGQQPLWNEDKTLFVIHNGEIYNIRQLRQELRSKGHTFYSRSDSEAILHLYEEYGVDGFERLLGTYAFCLWDTIQNKMILHRDRYGERPLFYSYKEGELIFASEIKAFQHVPDFNLSNSPEAMEIFLTYGNLVPPFTWFKNIHKLEIGHVLIYDGVHPPQKQAIRFKYPARGNKSFDHYLNEFDGVFKEVISDTIETTDEDIECCLLLSGGIDSSLSTLYANDITRNFSKFSLFGSSKGQTDEMDRAKLISSMSRGKQYIVQAPDARDIHVNGLLRMMDEPIASVHDIDIRQHLYGLVKDRTTVAVGAGFGDHAFLCGSTYIYPVQLDEKIKKFSWLGNIIPKSLFPLLKGKGQFLNAFDIYVFARHFHYHEALTFKKFCKIDQAASDKIGDLIAVQLKNFNPPDAVNAMTFLKQGIIRQYVLYIEDLIGMINQLEIRDPFTDNRIREFVCQVPLEFLSPLLKSDRYNSKHPLSKLFLRKALERKGGEKIRDVFNGLKVNFGGGKAQAEALKMELSKSKAPFDISKNAFLLEQCYLDTDQFLSTWHAWEQGRQIDAIAKVVIERIASLNIWLACHPEYKRNV